MGDSEVSVAHTGDFPYVKSRAAQSHRYREEMRGQQRWGMGMTEMREGGQKVQTSH